MTRVLALFLVLSGCSGGDGAAVEIDAGAVDFDAGTADLQPVTLSNAGSSALEGHTPRGFQGMGTGLFVGDNLNGGFPNGDGVQAFVSFDVSGISALQVESALLRSVPPAFNGTPLQDLGNLIVEEVHYESFSSALWDLAPEQGDLGCVLATSRDDPFECDLSALVQSSLDKGYSTVQLRLRLESAGDGDNNQDLVSFFLSDSNTNEPGLFSLDLRFTGGPSL